MCAVIQIKVYGRLFFLADPDPGFFCADPVFNRSNTRIQNTATITYFVLLEKSVCNFTMSDPDPFFSSLYVWIMRGQSGSATLVFT